MNCLFVGIKTDTAFLSMVHNDGWGKVHAYQDDDRHMNHDSSAVHRKNHD